MSTYNTRTERALGVVRAYINKVISPVRAKQATRADRRLEWVGDDVEGGWIDIGPASNEELVALPTLPETTS